MQEPRNKFVNYNKKPVVPNGGSSTARKGSPLCFCKALANARASENSKNQDETLNQSDITESCRMMVWSRSGPVEIRPISVPMASAKNDT
jgi:hypothetical protein